MLGITSWFIVNDPPSSQANGKPKRHRPAVVKSAMERVKKLRQPKVKATKPPPAEAEVPAEDADETSRDSLFPMREKELKIGSGTFGTVTIE